MFQRTIVLPMLWFRLGFGVNRHAINKMAVFPGLGLCFNRIRKNANSNVVALLWELESGRVEEIRSAKRSAGKIYSLPWRTLLCIERFGFFVVTRNPYARVLSAFLEKFRREKYVRRYRAFDLTPSGFKEFLSFLASGGLARNTHWDLQVKSLFLPIERYEAVLRFESLQDDLEAYLARRGLSGRMTGERIDYDADAGKTTGAASRLSDFYDDEAKALVARLYAADFEKLGYDPDRLDGARLPISSP